jgi:hypothetical protein
MQPWLNVQTSLPPPAGHAVPARLSELSAEWLTACLQHAGVLAGDARVASFETTRIGQGRGFAGQLARLVLRYEPEHAHGPRTLIGKFATDHAPTRAMMATISAYEREVRFYRELAADVGIATPRCYFAHYDAPQACFCVLLEDLSPASSVDMQAGLSVEQATLVLDQLAALHARWWGRVDEIEWLQLSDDIVRKVRDRFQGSLPGFQRQFASVYPQLSRVAGQIGELLSGDELLAKPQKPPMTLTHNDLHLDNVFLPTAAGGRFALIDWQSVSGSRHGISDVTRILSLGMTAELRRSHQAALLEHYHTRLRELGVRGYSLRQLKRRFREEMTAMVIISVLALDTLDFDVDGADRTIATMGQRIEQALADGHMSRLLFGMLLLIRARRWLRRITSGAMRLGSGA